MGQSSFHSHIFFSHIFFRGNKISGIAWPRGKTREGHVLQGQGLVSRHVQFFLGVTRVLTAQWCWDFSLGTSGSLRPSPSSPHTHSMKSPLGGTLYYQTNPAFWGLFCLCVCLCVGEGAARSTNLSDVLVVIEILQNLFSSTWKYKLWTIYTRYKIWLICKMVEIILWSR